MKTGSLGGFAPANLLGDPGYEYGGLRLILYTLPWGLIGQLPAAIGALAPSFIGDAVPFFVFVVLCGGANAYIVIRLFGYRLSRRQIGLIATAGGVMAMAAQLTAAARDLAARNYHWPSNVPKAAFLEEAYRNGPIVIERQRRKRERRRLCLGETNRAGCSPLSFSSARAKSDS